MFGNTAVRRHQAGTGIHHKQHDIGFFNRQQRLCGHVGFNALFRAINTAGIDNNKFLSLNLCTTVLTIPRQAGEISNQRIARTR